MINVAFSVSDFNECAVYGACSQTCTNTDGSYTCSCVEGYLPQPDNRSCKAKNGMKLTVSDDPLFFLVLLDVRSSPFCFVRTMFSHLSLRPCRSASIPSHSQLTEHPSHLSERSQSHLHQHQADHRYGLYLRPGDRVLDPYGRLPRCHPTQVCQIPQCQELHGGEDYQHLPQPAPSVPCSYVCVLHECQLSVWAKKHEFMIYLLRLLWFSRNN